MELSQEGVPLFFDIFCALLKTLKEKKSFEDALTFVADETGLCKKNPDHGYKRLKMDDNSRNNKICSGCFYDVINLKLKQQHNIDSRFNGIFKRRLPLDLIYQQISFLDQTLVTVEEAEEEFAVIDAVELDELNEGAYTSFLTFSLDKSKEGNFYAEIVKNIMQLLIVKLPIH